MNLTVYTYLLLCEREKERTENKKKEEKTIMQTRKINKREIMKKVIIAILCLTMAITSLTARGQGKEVQIPEGEWKRGAAVRWRWGR